MRDITDIDALVNWALEDEKQKITALDEEISQINADIEALEQELLSMGWTPEEIDGLKKEALRSING